MKTINIDLGNGDRAELYEQLKHGTARKIQEVYQPYYGKPEYQAALAIADVKERIKALSRVFSQADLTRATDVMILGQVKEWTFGEILQAVLDDMPEEKHEILAREANKLYEPPLAGSEAES